MRPGVGTGADKSMVRTVRGASGFDTYVGRVIGIGSHNDATAFTGMLSSIECSWSATSSAVSEIATVSSSRQPRIASALRAKSARIARTLNRATTRNTTIRPAGISAPHQAPIRAIARPATISWTSSRKISTRRRRCAACRSCRCSSRNWARRVSGVDTVTVVPGSASARDVPLRTIVTDGVNGISAADSSARSSPRWRRK